MPLSLYQTQENHNITYSVVALPERIFVLQRVRNLLILNSKSSFNSYSVIIVQRWHIGKLTYFWEKAHRVQPMGFFLAQLKYQAIWFRYLNLMLCILTLSTQLGQGN